MSKVSRSTPRQDRDAVAAERFQAYCKASALAQRTHDLKDGIAAGHAWRAFLDVFTGASQDRGGAAR